MSEHEIMVHATNVGGGFPATLQIQCSCGYAGGGRTSSPLDQLVKDATRHIPPEHEVIIEHDGMAICSKGRRHPAPCDFGSGV